MSGVERSTWLRVVAVAIWGAALALSPLASAQMGPGALDRPVDPRQNPFLLTATLSPEVPAPGEVVEIAAEVRSRIHPHIRTVVRFWINGQKREEQAYVIAPFAESVVVHEWTAEKGAHAIRIEVASPAGILYTSWERRITVRGK